MYQEASKTSHRHGKRPPGQAMRLPGFRIPVIVDHQVIALKIDPFTGGVCGQKDVYVRIMTKHFLDFETIFAPHGTVDQYNGVLASQLRSDAPGQVIQRVAMFREDDQLLPRRRLG